MSSFLYIYADRWAQQTHGWVGIYVRAVRASLRRDEDAVPMPEMLDQIQAEIIIPRVP